MTLEEIKKLIIEQEPIARCSRFYFDEKETDLTREFKTNLNNGLEITFLVKNEHYTNNMRGRNVDAKVLIDYIKSNA